MGLFCPELLQDPKSSEAASRPVVLLYCCTPVAAGYTSFGYAYQAEV
jgi:hypothetical protein